MLLSALQHNKPLYSFEDNADYVYDVMWSPVHPALFACVDGMGRLDLWNLNNDTEVRAGGGGAGSHPRGATAPPSSRGHPGPRGDRQDRARQGEAGPPPPQPRGCPATCGLGEGRRRRAARGWGGLCPARPFPQRRRDRGRGAPRLAPNAPRSAGERPRLPALHLLSCAKFATFAVKPKRADANENAGFLTVAADCRAGERMSHLHLSLMRRGSSHGCWQRRNGRSRTVLCKETTKSRIFTKSFPSCAEDPSPRPLVISDQKQTNKMLQVCIENIWSGSPCSLKTVVKRATVSYHGHFR